LPETSPIADDFREWQPDVWFDRDFLFDVPAPARMGLFRAIRPLSADLHQRIRKSLFAGIMAADTAALR
jgi:hypothetical protein